MAGILLGESLAGYAAAGHLAAVSSLLVLCYAALRGRSARLSPLVLLTALGYLAIQPWVSPVLPADHISRFADDAARRIFGQVLTEPVRLEGRRRFVLAVRRVEDGAGSRSASGKLRVTLPEPAVDLRPGDRITFEGKIRRPRNFHNPGGFDYRRYMAFQGIRATTWARKDSLSVLSLGRAAPGPGVVDRYRGRIRAAVEKAADGAATAVLLALVIGDRDGIPPALREDFNRVGVGHLLAISGLHIGTVAGIAFLLFRLLLSLWEPLLWRAWTRPGAALLAFLPALGYGAVSGWSPSTQRAVLMVGAFLLACLVKRETEPVNTLGLAALTILALHPPALFSISFQLSFAAVAAILLGLSALYPRDPFAEHPPKGMGERITAFGVVSLLAILGTLPLVAHSFNRVSLIGLLANFIFVPAIGFLVVPLGLFAAFTNPLVPWLSESLFRLDGWILRPALWLMERLSEIPLAAVRTVTPSVPEILIYYAIGLGLLGLIHAAKRPGAPGAVSRRTALAVVALGGLALAGDIFYWVHQRFLREDFRVTVIDVGQGSGALLELPGGRCMLLDGGGFYDNSIFDVGKWIIAPLLWRKKIRTVETLWLSHPNADHLNGLLYIAEHFHVKRIITNGEPAETEGYRALESILGRRSIERIDFDALDRSRTVDGVRFDILHPPVDFRHRAADRPWGNDENNNSLVVKATFGETSILFPGDIQRPAEAELIRLARGDLRGTVLLSPHHGSRTSSSPALLEAVSPEVVIISAGWRNRFRFPHPSVLDRYRKLGCRVFRTDLHGAVTLTTDGRRLRVQRCLEP